MTHAKGAKTMRCQTVLRQVIFSQTGEIQLRKTYLEEKTLKTDKITAQTVFKHTVHPSL